MSSSDEPVIAPFRVARVGRGRWQVYDVARETLVATFDGWRAARDHAKQLMRDRAPAALASVSPQGPTADTIPG